MTIVKKSVLGISALLVLFLAVGAGFGVTPRYLINAPAMLTGMGAKLACSGRYVSGLTEEQAFVDLQSYSGVLGLLELSFDEANKRVSADFLGLDTAEAQYRSGLGCSLNIGATAALDGAALKTVTRREEDWPQGDGASAINPRLQSRLQALLQADNEQGLQTRALLVVQNGELVAESYAAGIDPQTPLLGWSMAKSMTALMLGHLEMTGQLNPDQVPVFDDWKGDDRRHIQLEDLLHMSSGLDFPEVYEPGAAATEMLFVAHRGSDLPLAADLLHPPGSVFEYSSGTTNLLSRLIFELSGGTLQSNLDLLQDRFMTPLGLQDFVFEPDPSGILVGSSYLYASARDWARIGQLMLNGGELNDHRVVTEEWVARALEPNSSANRKSYGYQFWLNRGDDKPRWADLPADSFAALGNRKQVVMVVPEANAVIVRLGWTTGEYPTGQNMAEILSWLSASQVAAH